MELEKNETCGKCGYTRKDDDGGRDYACPKCGAIYPEIESVFGPVTKTPNSKETKETANSIKTKDCPFCGEEILAVAIKCKHCGSNLKSEIRKPKHRAKPRNSYYSKRREKKLKVILICLLVLLFSISASMIIFRATKETYESKLSKFPSIHKKTKNYITPPKRPRKKRSEAKKRLAKNKDDGLLKCMNALSFGGKIKFPSTIDYSWFGNQYQPNSAGGGRWHLSFEAKNALGIVLPYQAICEFNNGRAKIVSVRGR